MKGVFLIICVIIFCIIFESCSSSQVHTSNAKLELESDSLNIGTIKFTDTTYVNVKLSNTSTTEKLIIKKIKSSCDCTVPFIQDSVILPNSYSFFKLRMKPNEMGDFNRSVVIESNDSEMFKVLEIYGTVVK